MNRAIVGLSLLLLQLGGGQQRADEHQSPNQQDAEFMIVIKQQQVATSLRDLSSQIKELNEPALRILLRIEIATFLWRDVAKALPDVSGLAETVVSEAWADLEDPKSSLPASYADLCRNELLSLVKLHAPPLYDKLQPKIEKQDEKNEKPSPNPLGVTLASLNSKEGIDAAVDTVTQRLRSGQDPGNVLFFFLDRLQEVAPDKVPALLKEVLPIEERKPGTMKLQNLVSLRQFYLKQDSQNLTRRYLAVLLKSLELNPPESGQTSSSYSYNLLLNLLPAIKKAAPTLSEHAEDLITAFRDKLNPTTLDQIEVERRIEQSDDPLRDLQFEARAAKDEAFKQTLLRRAAKLALSKGQFVLAVDLEIEASDKEANSDWRDQFLGDIITHSLKKKDTEAADYAASKIRAVSKRAAAGQKIALFYLEARDLLTARYHLNEAAKLIFSEDSSLEKAKALLRLVPTFAKIDESRVIEIVQAAIKAINDHPRLEQKIKRDSKEYQNYIQSLTQLGWSLVPLFASLGEKDESLAFYLTKGIELPELRSIAFLGVCKGAFAAIKHIPTEQKK